jgi:hypothetical protein
MLKDPLVNKKSKRVAISVLAVPVACLIATALFLLTSTPASYTWIVDVGERLNETYLVKMCPDGTRVVQVQFGQSGAIGVDPQSGSIWAPELNDIGSVNSDQVVKLDSAGNILDRYGGYRTSVIAVDPNNGSVWAGLDNERQVVKLDSNGKQVLQIVGFRAPESIAVDPRDSSVWIADNHRPGQVVHLTPSGDELFRTATTGFFSHAPHQIAVDPCTGDIWYTDAGAGSVTKLSSAGNLLAKIDGFEGPVAIATSPTDGSVWVAEYDVADVVKLTSDGETSLSVVLDGHPWVVGVNPSDQTVWVGIDGAIVKLSEDGEILMTQAGFTTPSSIAFVAADDLMTWLGFLGACYGSF